MAAVSNRDLLLCILARQQQLLVDEELEAVVRAWQAQPQRPLFEVLVERAGLSASQAAKLQATAERQAGETCADPLRLRLRTLPTAIRQLLSPEESTPTTVSEPATKRGDLDTRAETPSKAAGKSWEQKTEGLTPGDRFDVLQIHAQGGLGVVFLARDREIERTVALKQIKAQWADDDDCRNRFLLEARVTGRLEHPGVVPIYAMGADASGRPYYAMRFIRGESLLEVLDRFHRSRAVELSGGERIAELRKLLARFLHVCHAVDYAHSKGVIHRDLKPSNIMLGKFGETLVVDWGLAKVIGSDEDVALTTRMVAHPVDGTDATSTQMGAAIGTPAYMSPEQAEGRHNELTPATDVYSLGATLYHLLTGWVPHAEDEDVGIALAKVESEQIVPPRRRTPWLPRPGSISTNRASRSAPSQSTPPSKGPHSSTNRNRIRTPFASVAPISRGGIRPHSRRINCSASLPRALFPQPADYSLQPALHQPPIARPEHPQTHQQVCNHVGHDAVPDAPIAQHQPRHQAEPHGCRKQLAWVHQHRKRRSHDQRRPIDHAERYLRPINVHHVPH
jgi:serine/threonine protein kinase